MPKLKSKSRNNLEAAQLLIENEKYDPSIHCSYYALLQRSKHFLCVSCSLPYENQDFPSKEENPNELGSHEFIYDKVLRHIDDDVMKNIFDTSFMHLKKKRNLADYRLYSTSKVEAEKALRFSQNAINIISNDK